MKLLDAIKKLFGRNKQLAIGDNETSLQGETKNKPFLAKVPGVKDTEWAKDQAISDYQKLYNSLYEQRDKITFDQIREVETRLGLYPPRQTRNLDEFAAEVDRRDKILICMDSAYKKHQSVKKHDELMLKQPEELTPEEQETRDTEPEGFTPEELVILDDVLALKKLLRQKDQLSIQILAIRQGFINIADRDNSQLDESLQEEHETVESFIEADNERASKSFIRAVDIILNQSEIEALAPLTELPIDNARIMEAYNNSANFRLYCDTLFKMNRETGKKTTPLRFEGDPNRERGVRISLAGRQSQLTHTQE